MSQKGIFKQFLNDRFPDGADALFRKFEAFHSWLVCENAKINLFSRQMDPENVWTVHFLDSLLSIQHVDFRGMSVLDFGTGGGMPGIPLAIVYGNGGTERTAGAAGTVVTLLDSTKKKIAAVKRAAEYLRLDNCQFIDKRIEEAGRQYHNCFDLIVSRSVKIESAYKSTLLKLLKPGGRIVLYKSKILDDARQFGEDNVRIFDVGNDLMGERKIVVINT